MEQTPTDIRDPSTLVVFKRKQTERLFTQALDKGTSLSADKYTHLLILSHHPNPLIFVYFCLKGAMTDCLVLLLFTFA